MRHSRQPWRTTRRDAASAFQFAYSSRNPAASYLPPIVQNGCTAGAAGFEVVSNIYTVFLSSTRKDLVAYREAAATAINKVPEFKCVGMEDFGAVDGDAATYCPAAVKACDVFVILLGLCYGSRPAPDQPSYTEAEYDAARNGNRPRLVFFAPDNFPVPRDLAIADFKENGDAQDRFRQRVLDERVAARFDTPEALANEIVLALHRWVRQADKKLDDRGKPRLLLNNVPDYPPAYVRRPGDLDAIRDALAAENTAAVGLVSARNATAVQGMGGVGKTVLAIAAARDPNDPGSLP